MALFGRWRQTLYNSNKIMRHYCFRLIQHYSRNKCCYVICNNRSRQIVSLHQFSTTKLNVLSFKMLEHKLIALYASVKNGRVFLYDLEEIIVTYEEGQYKLPDATGIVLLKCCGAFLPDVKLNKRRELTERVWKLIEKNDCRLTLEHYNTLLSVYMDNLQPVNPEEFLQNITVVPNLSTYSLLLNIMAKTENYKLASVIISKMHKMKHSFTEEIFNTLVELHAMQDDFTGANKIIESMSSLEIAPSSQTFAGLACGYAKKGDIPNVTAICQKYRQNVTSVMKLVKILSINGYGEHIPNILLFLNKPSVEDEHVIINTIIELMYNNYIEDSQKIIDNLPKDWEISNIYNEYANCFLSDENRASISNSHILNLVQHLISNSLLIKAAEVALYYRREELTLPLFEDMKKNSIPVRPHYYWPLFIKAHETVGEIKIYKLIRHMTSLGVHADEDTLINYVLPYINIVEPTTTLGRLLEHGVLRSDATTALVLHLLSNNQLTDAVSLYKKKYVKMNPSRIVNFFVEKYKITKNIDETVKLLIQLSYDTNDLPLYFLRALLSDSSIDIQLIYVTLEALKKYGVKISKSDENFIKQCIANNYPLNSTKSILSYDDLQNENVEIQDKDAVLAQVLHPKHMTTEELARHLTELKIKNMNIRGTLRKLLQSYCRRNDLKAAESIKEEIVLRNMEWSPGMRSNLFYLYVRNEMIEEAMIQFNEIVNNFNNFKIDDFKVVDFATLLTRRGKINEAVHIIETFTNISRTNNTAKCCARLLKAIMENSNDDWNYINKALNALIKNKYCTTSNTLLAPLINVHLSRNDLTAALSAFKNCVKFYRLTPSKQRIITELIRNTEGASFQRVTEQLKEVQNYMSMVHKEDQFMTKLFIALAECRKIAELETLVKNDISPHFLINDLQNYPDKTKKLEILLTIFDASKGVQNKWISSLCDLTLSIYNEAGDWKDAIAFRQRMEQAKIKPSQHFENVFENLLTANQAALSLEHQENPVIGKKQR